MVGRLELGRRDVGAGTVETLRMGVLYETAAVDFWTEAIAKVRPTQEPEVVPGT